ncbi:hypothetical protein C8Q75DRAFT_775218 [Abortiporus biennis]|nr:hypothetical protein C8Q75DRAFT_775218 [Abortiporus biennis]
MQADAECLRCEDETLIKYNRHFCSAEGDIVLGSRDGIYFRIHSFTLKMASGWFRAMLSLPQRPGSLTPSGSQTGRALTGRPSTPLPPHDPSPPAKTFGDWLPHADKSRSSSSLSFDNTIYVDEDSTTLEGLLRMISGLPIPKLDSYEMIEPILFAAEKYDMPGPPSIIRAIIMTGPFIKDPLRLYALCCLYGWEREAKEASAKTLSLNLHNSQHRSNLQKLNTDAILNLFELHHNRRETLRKRLNEPPFVNDTGDASCSHCGATVNYQTWRELKMVIVLEMDNRPLGDTVLNVGLNDWPSARACWNAKCSHCDRVLYDKKETLRAVKECIDQLPSSVEFTPLDPLSAPFSTES